MPARDRKRLERLARYCGRPPIATDRLSQLDDGRLCYRLKHRWRDGTTHIVLDPIDLLERLATFVPSPRSHMVHYHGILAPCAGWRGNVVPQGAEPTPQPAGGLGPLAHRQGTAAPGGKRPTEQPSLGGPLRGDSGEAPTTGQAGSSLAREPPAQQSSKVPSSFPRSPSPARPRRLSWAELLERVFGIEALRCSCGKQMRVLAAITEPEAIRAILDCLNLPSRAPPLAPARREREEFELDFGESPLYDD